MKTKQHHDLVKDTEIFGVSLSLLISRANEKSVTMPSGLSREQRRKWAAEAVALKRNAIVVTSDKATQ